MDFGWRLLMIHGPQLSAVKKRKEPEKEAKQRGSCCQADAGLHARVRGSNSAGQAGHSFSFILL
jgi:hypothetical protein